MAASVEDIAAGRKVSIQEGQRLSASGVFVVFRPEENLPEELQYAVVVYE